MKALLVGLLKKAAGFNWLGFLLSNWQGCLCVVFIAWVFVACHQRDAAKEAQGRAEQADKDKGVLLAQSRHEAKEATDSVASLGNQLDAMHSDYEQELGLLGQKLGRVDTLAIERWLHDTVSVGDTIRIPAAAVLQADTVIRACSEFMNTCAEFRAYAAKRFAADSQTISILKQPTIQPTSHRCGIQATAGVGAVGTSIHDVRYGPGLVLGVGCHW